MQDSNMQQDKQVNLSGSYLDRPCISYAIPIKTRMRRHFESLRDRRFSTNYPLTKKEDWRYPACDNPTYKHHLISFILITVALPILLLLMPIGILLDYQDHLEIMREVKKEFIAYKKRYLNGEW